MEEGKALLTFEDDKIFYAHDYRHDCRRRRMGNIEEMLRAVSDHYDVEVSYAVKLCRKP